MRVQHVFKSQAHSTMEKSAKKKKVFIEGAITPAFIADSIAKHSVKKEIGAHNYFLGQVRADEKDGVKVGEIEYSCYQEMAEEELHKIREEAFSRFSLTCMHIYHSLGSVKAGDICLFVFVSSSHRKEVFESLEWIVEQIKKRVPIWGREIAEDGKGYWKENIFLR